MNDTTGTSNVLKRQRGSLAVLERLREQSRDLVELEQVFTDSEASAFASLVLPSARARNVGRQIEALDREFRRAVRFCEVGWGEGYVRPIRPDGGGLEVVTAQSGSFEVLAHFYGAAEAWATMHPIALAFAASVFLKAKAVTVRWYQRERATRGNARTVPPLPDTAPAGSITIDNPQRLIPPPKRRARVSVDSPAGLLTVEAETDDPGAEITIQADTARDLVVVQFNATPI